MIYSNKLNKMMSTPITDPKYANNAKILINNDKIVSLKRDYKITRDNILRLHNNINKQIYLSGTCIQLKETIKDLQKIIITNNNKLKKELIEKDKLKHKYFHLKFSNEIIIMGIENTCMLNDEKQLIKKCGNINKKLNITNINNLPLEIINIIKSYLSYETKINLIESKYNPINLIKKLPKHILHILLMNIIKIKNNMNNDNNDNNINNINNYLNYKKPDIITKIINIIYILKLTNPEMVYNFLKIFMYFDKINKNKK